MSDSPWLEFKQGSGESYRRVLPEGELVLGRESGADLALPYPQISRRHARLERRPDGCYLSDLGSQNGTYLNGQPLGSQAQRLQHGDEIVLGGVVALSFQDPAQTSIGPRLGRLHGVWIDPLSRQVWVDARPVEPPLSAPQLRLLELLVQAQLQAPGQVVTRAQIIRAVWPADDPAGISEEAVDGLIKRLRARLRQAQPARETLEVLRGHGLRLLDP